MRQLLMILIEFEKRTTNRFLSCPIFAEACDPGDMNALLLKEAVYNAMGLAAFELFDEVDFDQWLTSHLLSELQNKHPR